MAKEFPPYTHTHLNYIIFFNIVHIPDKPGQSHNTQDFESTLSEVRFFFYSTWMFRGLGYTLCGKMGSHL